MKILAHRDNVFPKKDGTQRKSIYLIVQHIEGDDDEIDELHETVFDKPWEYIEAPTQDEIDLARTANHHKSEVYECNHCSSKQINMRKCANCMKARYCSTECQKEDWPTHQKDCKKKIKIKIENPRYPLANPDLNQAMNEKMIQDTMNDVLQDALTGKFKLFKWSIGGSDIEDIVIDDDGIINPKSTDVVWGTQYAVVTQLDQYYILTTSPIEPESHCSSPTSCSVYNLLDTLGHGDSQMKSIFDSLHFLIMYASQDATSLFWRMAINFNTFGTVAPFDINCKCAFSKKPRKFKQLLKFWDGKFKRAKEDLNDILCVYSNSEQGCHAFGLPDGLGCRYKHYIFVEKEDAVDEEHLSEIQDVDKSREDLENKEDGGENKESTEDGGENKESKEDGGEGKESKDEVQEFRDIKDNEDKSRSRTRAWQSKKHVKKKKNRF